MHKLVVLDGEEAGTTILIEDRITVGRHPSRDLYLTDVAVAPLHAEIWLDDDEARICNHAINGILVNGERIESAGSLHDNDIVQIGTACIRIAKVDAKDE